MKIPAFYIFIIIFLNSIQISGQEYKKNNSLFYLHSLADTISNPSYTPYINFWIKFLYTENDSVRKTFWNPDEVVNLKNDYVLFYDHLFQYSVKPLLNYFKPYILSVYFEDRLCHITTAFWNFSFTPSDTSALLNSNPFAILEVGIMHKGNKMYLTNLLDKRTINWQTFTHKKIKYVVEPSLKINYFEVEQACIYVDSLAKLFSINYDTISYIVCRTPQSLGYILGFNFFYSGFTFGRAFLDARMIISGRGTFTYPHELTHMILNPYIKPGKFYSEGLATFFGGSLDKNYKQLFSEFKNNFSKISDSEFNKIIKYPNSPTAYTLSALIVEIIYNQYGIEGLKKLSESPNNPNEFLFYLYDKLKISKKAILKKMNLILNQVNQP